ncbi:substrate-binding domain-containing protein [Leptolyngbya sp. 15MV]|nr:substrate-binding domain-containing protein [Leptolyngbya sp. 15MV]
MLLAGAALALATPALAQAIEIAVIGFQMSSETHARAANAAAAAARAKGWTANVLNSEGALPRHAEQLDTLIGRRPRAIIACMSRPVEMEAQYQRAKAANIPVITIMSGASTHNLFDIQVNEYKVGADSALWLLGELGYQGIHPPQSPECHSQPESYLHIRPEEVIGQHQNKCDNGNDDANDGGIASSCHISAEKDCRHADQEDDHPRNP